MIEAAIQRIIQRVQHVIGRGRVTTGNDAGNVQLLQVKLGADEIGPMAQSSRPGTRRRASRV
jgi:phage gp45-like